MQGPQQPTEEQRREEPAPEQQGPDIEVDDTREEARRALGNGGADVQEDAGPALPLPVLDHGRPPFG